MEAGESHGLFKKMLRPRRLPLLQEQDATSPEDFSTRYFLHSDTPSLCPAKILFGFSKLVQPRVRCTFEGQDLDDRIFGIREAWLGVEETQHLRVHATQQ